MLKGYWTLSHIYYIFLLLVFILDICICIPGYFDFLFVKFSVGTPALNCLLSKININFLIFGLATIKTPSG